jgi:uncharacterized protein YycO
VISLRFVEGGGLDSKIIRFDTRCRWSHVEWMPTATSTLGAMLEGGVNYRSIANPTDPIYKNVVATQIFQIHSDTILVNGKAAGETLFEDFMHQQVGKPYDWRAITSFGLGQRDWRKPDSWFCSELIARALEIAGVLHLPEDQPVWRITPRDVWMLVNALRSAGYATAFEVKGKPEYLRKLHLAHGT